MVKALAVLILLAVVFGGGALSGCRKAIPPADGGTADPGGQNPDGSGGSAAGRSGGTGNPAGQMGALQVTVSDNRLKQFTTDYASFDSPAYLEIAVSPGQKVLVGQGGVSINLAWLTPVGRETVEPFVTADPPPPDGVTWFPDWSGGSLLRLSYPPPDRPDGASGIQVTLKAGLSLGYSRTLAEDFVFTVRRGPEPAVTASVKDLPWVQIPYEGRVIAGYVVPPGRYTVRFDFSQAPDQASVAETLGRLEAPWELPPGAIVGSRWDGDRTLFVDVDLPEETTSVFNLNGAVVPGGLRVAHEDPLVLVAARATALAYLDDPRSPSPMPRLLPLAAPLVPGSLSPAGDWALLWEESPTVFCMSDAYPAYRLLPWAVRTSDGQGWPLSAAAEPESCAGALDEGGWAADGRLVLPAPEEVVAVTLSGDVPGRGADVSGREVLYSEAAGEGRGCLSRAISGDGRYYACLELDPPPVAGENRSTMTLVVLDLATGRAQTYPAAAPADYEADSYFAPPILWWPLGETALPPVDWRRPGIFRVFDPTGGKFVERQFLGPDGKPLAASAWTMHDAEADWLADGRAIGSDEAGKVVLVTATGRVPLDFGSPKVAADSQVYRAEFSPAGDLVAVERGGFTWLFRCPGGEKVWDRALEGRLLGWTKDGRLWLVKQAAG